MNKPMPKHWKVKLGNLVQPRDNNHMSNQYPFETKKGLMAVITNFDELFPTCICNWRGIPPTSIIFNTHSGKPLDS
jgi:hypothetical protein